MTNRDGSIAIFDLDGTLTYKDTFLTFIKYCNGKFNFYSGLLLLTPHIFLFYLGKHSNSKLKEIFFSYFFKGLLAEDIQKKGDEFSTKILSKLVRKSANDILEWHTEQNHKILILSASADIWLKKWCLVNNFELICTKFQIKDNRYTGYLEGSNCYGLQKKTLLKQYFNKNNYSYSFGYGDSSADQHFLELVDEPYLMKLNKNNVVKNWPHKI